MGEELCAKDSGCETSGRGWELGLDGVGSG